MPFRVEDLAIFAGNSATKAGLRKDDSAALVGCRFDGLRIAQLLAGRSWPGPPRQDGMIVPTLLIASTVFRWVCPLRSTDVLVESYGWVDVRGSKGASD
jgi:hypothetical protein